MDARGGDNMNKRHAFGFALLLLALALLLCGCGAAPKKPLDETVSAALVDKNGLMDFPADELEMIADITADGYTEYVYLTSEDGVSAREVIVLRAKDRQTAADIRQKLTDYLERRRIETRDYLPDEYQLLSQAKVESKNLTVALIIGKDAARETEALLKQE